ncbi:hypothetical protein BOKEGFJH_00626 [Chlamydia avium]|uniref:Uncharacterized protein n=2 Tax=Chlamydia avium TaxID=1457141 RepID=W8K0T4_9CHLA|nr:hypothetical protein [Chlamydia avium]AHK63502.1 Uncharacterized protein M832_06390 [Chlamydia avium 10DC88]EPP37034.1 hypothetical protein CP10743SC13_0978 [Chlamydia psittaci 10_743_SC13]EPP38570.1 hypothetical protein CP10881SC42_0075 [Chlamydia avium]VVT43095.1 hypothetical protein BOKEGFJH_00626 [Chlamydia avium]
METTKKKELSSEIELLKKMRDRAVSIEEQKKRKVWVEKLISLPESTRDVSHNVVFDTPEIFKAIAEKICEEGV